MCNVHREILVFAITYKVLLTDRFSYDIVPN